MIDCMVSHSLGIITQTFGHLTEASVVIVWGSMFHHPYRSASAMTTAAITKATTTTRTTTAGTTNATTMTNVDSPHPACHRRHNDHQQQDMDGSIRSSSSSDSNSSNASSHTSSPTAQKKKTAKQCIICGKRLMKLAKWRNYLVLPCKCHHTFCKCCITERLRCRQKVMGETTYDLLWTFPCPGSAQCGQELHVDWSKGRSYSKNLVARNLGSSDDSWDPEEEAEGTLDAGSKEGNVFNENDLGSYRGHQYHDVSGVVREIG